MKNYQDKRAFELQNQLDTKYNFDQLVLLTNRTKTTFKVIGSCNNFAIHSNIPFMFELFMIILILIIPTFFLCENLANLFWWMLEFGCLAGIYLIYRYGIMTNNFEINSYDKIIKINSNTFLGKYIVPTISFKFKDFKEFKFKSKSSEGEGDPSYYNAIYVSYNNRTIRFIDLENGPKNFVNHRIFMACLAQIIKNGVH